MRALVFIIESLVQIYLIVLLLRFWLPLLRADFRNPVAQGILKLTSPIVVPVRRILPSIGRIDSATIVLSFLIQFLLTLTILALQKSPAGYGEIALVAAFELVFLNLYIFMFAIVIYVLMSWIAPNTYNPVTALVATLVLPILQPFSRMLPKLGGIDISPLIVILLFQATIILLNDVLNNVRVQMLS